ncbi:MAG: hypothetical protein PHY93_00080 [Bacteriovorax sp.]|nr:hypothetical protein [Bacteriovorax sp.]
MNKIVSTTLASIFSLIFLTIHQWSYADTGSDCVALNEEISNFEKDFLLNSQLLISRKQEIEKLPPEATSTKMKLTADIFMIAAKKRGCTKLA